MVVEISSRAALLCVAALTALCFATATGAVPPARRPTIPRSLLSDASQRAAGRRPKEYPCGREGRADRHRCAYEAKARMIEAGEISPWPLSAYPEDPSIGGAVQWSNVSSDQLPLSLAASPANDGSIFVLRGSMRTSRNPSGVVVQVNSVPGSAELLKLNAANGAASARLNLGSFGNPQRLAVDADRNLWIADRTSAEVVKLSGRDYSRMLSVGGPPSQTASAPAARHYFCLPVDVVAATATSADGSGRAGNFIYIADSTSQTSAAAAPSRDHCLGEGGSPRRSRVVRVNASDGSNVDSVDLPSEVLGQVRLSVDPRLDRLYVADHEAGRIYAYSAGLRTVGTAASGGSSQQFGRRLDLEEIAIDGKIVDVQAHPTRDQLYVVAIIGTERFTFGFTVNVSQPAMRTRWTPPSQPYGFYWFHGLVIDSTGSAMYAADDDGATMRLWKFNIV